MLLTHCKRSQSRQVDKATKEQRKEKQSNIMDASCKQNILTRITCYKLFKAWPMRRMRDDQKSNSILCVKVCVCVSACDICLWYPLKHIHIQIVVCLHMQIAHTPRDARWCIWHWQLAKEESAPASVFALPKFINQKTNASSKRNNIYLCICLFAFSHLHTHKVKFPLSISLTLFACLFHSKGKRRVTRMVVVVVLAFAICWLPIHVSIFLWWYIW